jgi:plasmid stabilization system protein ParE
MKVLFSQLAQLELEDACRFYAHAEPGLDRRFKSEVRKTALRIAGYPRAWPTERGDVRKCLIHRFPYKLLYSIESDHILVVALAHQHRRPDYWVDELHGR